MRFRLVVTSLVATSFLYACGGGSSTTPTASNGSPVSTGSDHQISISQNVINGSNGGPSVTMFSYNTTGVPAFGGVTVAKDGAVWWETWIPNNTFMVRMKSNTATTIPLPSVYAYWSPDDTMTATPDGRVYGSLNGNGETHGPANNMVFATATSATAQQVANQPGYEGALLGYTVAGPDGNVWWTQTYFDNVQNQTFSLFGNTASVSNSVQVGDQLTAIAVGPDHLMWAGGTINGGKAPGFYRASMSGTIAGTVLLSKAVSINAAVTGPDGAVWIAGSGVIARTDTSGNTTTYPLPHAGYTAEDITVGGDGALWFTEDSLSSNTSYVGRITTSGSITEYALPTGDYQPREITGPLTAPGCAAASLWVSTTSGQVIQIAIGK